jgi:3-oxoacyl-[acyl-carrier-protein] synthase II
MARRVVVTGMGVVSSLGLTLDDFWNACVGRVSGVRPYDVGGEQPLPIRCAAPVDLFTGDIADFGELEGSLKKDLRKSLKLMSREIQMGVASAQRAIADARIGLGDLDPARVGVSYGADYIITTIAELSEGVMSCLGEDGFDFSLWPSRGMTKMTPLWQLKFLTNMITSHLSILNQFRGLGCNVTNRESSISTIVGESVEIIRRGHVDVMVVGATGSRLHPLQIVSSVRNESTASGDEFPPEELSRPYDLRRVGAVLGEGAGALVLEDFEHARKRGVPIYAEVLGGANSAVLTPDSDPGSGRYFEFDSFANLEESMTLTLRRLCEKVGRSFDSVGHINGQGAATPVADAAESSAIRAAFGDLAARIPLTTIKGHTGNSGAGGNAADLIASVLALKNGVLFPILNNTDDDPACPIFPVRSDGVAPGDSFIKTGCHPFGQTSAVWVCRCES